VNRIERQVPHAANLTARQWRRPDVNYAADSRRPAAVRGGSGRVRLAWYGPRKLPSLSSAAMKVERLMGAGRRAFRSTMTHPTAVSVVEDSARSEPSQRSGHRRRKTRRNAWRGGGATDWGATPSSPGSRPSTQVWSSGVAGHSYE